MNNKTEEPLIIHILNIQEVERHEAFLLSYVSKERKDLALSIKIREKQLQSLGAAYFLRRYTSPDKSFSFNNYHKPLKDREYFNLAHSGEKIVFVSFASLCGIDIEEIRPAKEKLVQYAFSSDQQEHIHTNEDFFRYWTLKEAIGKANGNGLIDNSIKDIPAIEGKTEYQGKTFDSKSFLKEGYYISVSVLNELPKDIRFIDETIEED